MHNYTWDVVRRSRLARNLLVQPAAGGQLSAAAGAVCGIQAQVLSAAQLALGARVAGGDQPAVQHEIWERRGLVKTYGPRGTIHLLPANELPLWMAAMQAREDLQEKKWYAAVGLDPTQAGALVEAIGAALDGRSLTRAALTGAVSERVGEWAREMLASTWGEYLRPAAYAGWLCYGPSQGSQVTFVRADQWIGGWQPPDPRAALLEIARRYIAAFGPVTPSDFARWFWMPLTAVEGLFADLAGELVRVSIASKPAWVLAAQHGSLAEDSAPGPLRLLPQYDCYVLGSNPREKIVPEPGHRRILSHKRGRFEGAVGLPVVLVDGLVLGMWEMKQRSKQVDLKIEPFFEVTPAHTDQAAQEVDRIGRFLNTKAVFQFGRLE